MKTILIQNGTVYDGLGNPGRRADVLLAEGKVAAIGDRITQSADITIDAAGKAVTPGFVDIHRHHDAKPLNDPRFGIVELDMKEGVFRNTYRLGLSVNGMATDGSHIFLTTTKGVYVADCSDNLFQVDSWKCVNTSQFYEVYWFDNLLVTRHKQGIYALNAATGKIARLVKGGSFGFLRLTDGMLYWAGSDEVGWCSTTDKAQTVEMDNEWLDVSAKAGTLWVSEGMQGLRCYGVEGNSLQPAAGPVQPNSPAHDLFYRMQWAGDRLLVAGGINTVESIYNPPTAMYMQHGEWVNLPPLTAEDCPDSYEGMVISNTTSLVQDPADENHHFASLHRNGLCEYRDGQLVHFYHSDNSPLRSILPSVSTMCPVPDSSMMWTETCGCCVAKRTPSCV